MKIKHQVFTKFLVGGGTCFRGQFFSPPQGQSQMGGGGLASGTESDEGYLEKLSAEAKNAYI